MKTCRKAVQKERNNKRYPLTLDLKPFRSQVKGKHSTAENSTVQLSQEKTITSRNGDIKIMHSIRITSGSPRRFTKSICYFLSSQDMGQIFWGRWAITVIARSTMNLTLSLNMRKLRFSQGIVSKFPLKFKRCQVN